jgi:hypothetical protein
VVTMFPEKWKNSVRQPYLRRTELVKLAWIILLDKKGIAASGEMPLLERNYMEKHGALSRTARALTEDRLTIMSARNLHGCPCPEIPY